MKYTISDQVKKYGMEYHWAIKFSGNISAYEVETNDEQLRSCYERLSTEHFSSDLNKYIESDGVLNGDLLQVDYFPNTNPDIFISHSHADEITAIIVAVWLKKKLGVNSFIDSLVWKNEKKLRDNFSHCGERNNVGIYMMLANALATIIHKSQCVLFINSTNSIYKDNKTLSPWLPYEVNLIHNIIENEQKLLSAVPGLENFSEKVLLEEIDKRNIASSLNFEHFVPCTIDLMEEWEGISKQNDDMPRMLAFKNFLKEKQKRKLA